MSVRSGSRLAGLVLLSALAGCAGPVLDNRTVVGPQPRTNAEAVYRENLSTLVASDRVKRTPLSSLVSPAAAAAPGRSLQADAARLADDPLDTTQPKQGRDELSGSWRVSRQTFHVGPDAPADSANIFRFSTAQARRIELLLARPQDQAFRISLDCDGTVQANGKPTPSLSLAFARDETPPVLKFSGDVNRCDATVVFPETGNQRRYELRRDNSDDITAGPDAFEICAAADGAGMTELEKAFYKPRWLSQTCPFEPESVTLLREERAAFNGKVRLLLGRALPDSFYDRADPTAPIDFSHAPRLSLIYVSYLDIKADFSGKVFDRLLRYHAARGATIRIIATKILERKNDREMIERLATDYPNVQYREFAWTPPPGSGLNGKITSALRVHHVKMLAALSPDPGRSGVVIGSRNIHDGYLYKDPVDLSRFPNLNHYRRSGGMTLDYYSNWTDFDLGLDGDRIARLLAGHLSTLWNGDAGSWVTRPFSIAGKARQRRHDGVMRHFLSVPFADGEALEDYYVDLFSAAQHSIEIVNPYLNLTPRLREAFEGALDRGVRVTLVGRINLNGDLAGNVLTQLNLLFLERYGDRITFREYRQPEVLLHAKILMIDQELVLVSSVNLNNRSFIHDTENGVAVLDRAFYRRMRAIFDYYYSAAEPISEAKVSTFWKAVLSIPILRQAL